jgi:hypothetical protein
MITDLIRPMANASTDRRPQVPIRWSSQHISELERFVSDTLPGRNAIESRLVSAQLSAVRGDFAGAEVIAAGILSEEGGLYRRSEGLFLSLLTTLFVVQRLDLAIQLLVERYAPRCTVELTLAEPESGPGFACVVWEILMPGRMRFTFDSALLHHDETHTRVLWFARLFPLFTDYVNNWPGDNGSVVISLWDCGIRPGLAESENRPEYFLIPDNHFVSSHSYDRMRRHFSANDVPWDRRQPIAIWRGSTSGHPTDPRISWRSLPRVKLCQIAHERPDLIDAGISRIVQFADTGIADELQAAGLMRPFMPATELNKYKFQIDIDGNTNSWPGLFEKLLTGSPVLKVASLAGYRQWYYDRLEPWVNYVPICTDMSDLIEIVEWLRAHDDIARSIGYAGKVLTEAMSYEAEMVNARRTISASLCYFGGRPETSLRFGLNCDGNAYLAEGWSDPEEGFVWSIGSESRILLSSPIASGDFSLELDLEPHVHPGVRPTQRLAVSANGELIGSVKLHGRKTVRFVLPERARRKSRQLALTLLHPDSISPTAHTPGRDYRRTSFALRELKLIPLSIAPDAANHYNETGTAVMDAEIPNPPTRAGTLSFGQEGAMLEIPRVSKSEELMRRIHGTDIYAGFVPTFATDLQGWNSDHPVFRRIITEIRPQIIIDVGVWKGGSTIAIARMLRDAAIDGAVISVDTFLGSTEHSMREYDLFDLIPRRHGIPLLYEQFLANVVRSEVQDRVVPFPQTSENAAVIFRRIGIRSGLIHIDAAHEYEAALRDARAYWELVESGGYLVGDDYGPGHPGVIKAADEFAREVGVQLEVDGPKWILRKA